MTMVEDQEDEITSITSIAELWDTPFIVISIVARIIYAISSFGVICVIFEIVTDLRRGGSRNTTVASRLILGEMFAVIPPIVASVAGNMVQPKETGIWGAWGNETTCNVQAFMLVTGLTVYTIYDNGVSITYLLMVKYEWKEASLRKMEKFVHGYAITCLLLGICTWVFIDGYGPNGSLTCFFQTPPRECKGWTAEEGTNGTSSNISLEVQEVCEKAERAQLALNIFNCIITLALPISTGCVILIYCTVRAQEKRNEQYLSHYMSSTLRVSPNNAVGSEERGQAITNRATSSTRTLDADSRRRNYLMSRKVGIEGLLFSSSIYFMLFPILAVQVVAAIQNDYKSYAGGIAICFQAIGGIYFFFVFVRRRSEMKTGYGRWIRKVALAIMGTCVPCMLPEDVRRRRRADRAAKNKEASTTARNSQELAHPIPYDENETRGSKTNNR